MRTTITAERELDAPAAVLYHCLADYRTHHRPDGFLPPAFSDLEVTEGRRRRRDGGALGRRRRRPAGRSARGSPNRPGPHAPGDRRRPRDHVHGGPDGTGARVRFETVIDEPGIRGLLTRLFAPRMLAPLYADELQRLGEYARTHGPLAD